MSQLFAGSNSNIKNITKGSSQIQGFYKGSELLWPNLLSFTVSTPSVSSVVDVTSSNDYIWYSSSLLSTIRYSTDGTSFTSKTVNGTTRNGLAKSSDGTYVYVYQHTGASAPVFKYINSALNTGTIKPTFSDSSSWSSYPVFGDTYYNQMAFVSGNGSISGNKYVYAYFNGTALTVVHSSTATSYKNTIAYSATLIYNNAIQVISGSLRSYLNPTSNKIAYATNGNMTGKLVGINASAVKIYNLSTSLAKGTSEYTLPFTLENIMYNTQLKCFIGISSTNGIYCSTNASTADSWFQVSSIGCKKLVYAPSINGFVGITSSNGLLLMKPNY